jgi:hypothetical protein
MTTHEWYCPLFAAIITAAGRLLLALLECIHELEKENDQELLKMGAEAQLMGENAIRKKYRDGAVSPLDIAPTPLQYREDSISTPSL